MGVTPFLCAVDLRWEGLSFDQIRTETQRLSNGCPAISTFATGSVVCAIGTASNTSGAHLVHLNGATAIGNIRLDDVACSPHGGELVGTEQTDLARTLCAWVSIGDAALPTLVGDFAVVMVNPEAREVVACRDAFGVRLLVTKQVGSILFFASDAWILGGSRFNSEYVGQFILGSQDEQTTTVFHGVDRVAPGSARKVKDSALISFRHWSLAEINPSCHSSADPLAFTELLGDAIRARVGREEAFCAQLSGGLDSSSVVSMCTAMEKKAEIGPLAGTITIVDSLGEGDETHYSDHVVEAFGLQNHKIVDAWPWRHDVEAAPRFCDPHPFYAFFHTRRTTCEIVREAGAKVLLTGLGADHYLSAGYDFIADRIWNGDISGAVEIAFGRAVCTRKSFWKVLWRHGMLPLLPSQGQRWFSAGHLKVPSWMRKSFVRKYGLDGKLITPRPSKVGRGHVHEYEIETALGSLDHFLARGVYETKIEARHPFLHRPLVEYALSFPVGTRMRAREDKCLLREAMVGILPERVRVRRSKGGIDARIVWALQHENRLLTELVRNSVLVSCNRS